MKKSVAITTGVVIIAAAGIIAAPYILKNKIEPTVKGLQLPKALQDKFAKLNLISDLKTVSYTDNGLNADSVVRITISKKQSAYRTRNNLKPQSFCFDIANHIDYGYGTIFSGDAAKIDSKLLAESKDEKCGFTNNPKMMADQNAKRIIGQLFKDGSPITAETGIGFSRSVDTTINVKDLKIQSDAEEQKGATFISQAATLEFSRDAEGKQVQSSINWGGFNFTQYSSYTKGRLLGKVSLGQITGQSDSELASGSKYLYLGDMNLNVDSFKFHASGFRHPIDYSFGKSSLTASSSADGDKLKSNFDFMVSAVNFSGHKFEKGQFQATVSNLNKKAMIELMDVVRHDEKYSDVPRYKYDDLIAKKFITLTQGAHVSIEPLKLMDDGKEVSLSGDFKVANLDVERASRRSYYFRRELAKATKGEVKIALDTPVVRKLAGMVAEVTLPSYRRSPESIQRMQDMAVKGLDRATKMGYLTHKENSDRYNADLKFENGSLQK